MSNVADFSSDPTLNGLLKWWEEQGKAPKPLIDFCLDCNLVGAAENVRWALDQKDRKGWDGKLGGIRPYAYASDKYFWARGPLSRSAIGDRYWMGRLLGEKRYFLDYKTALIAFMDSYEKL